MNKKINYWVYPAVYGISEDEIFNRIFTSWETNLIEVQSRKRNRNIVEARAILGWYYVKRKKLTLSNAGLMVNKDHATIIHYIKMLDNLLHFDKDFKDKFLTIFHINKN